MAAFEEAKSCSVPIGTTIDEQRTLVRLVGERLATHLHCIGATGTGKTRFLVHLLLEIVRRTDCTIVLIDPKGDLYDLAIAALLADGMRDELVVFNLEDP